MVKQVPTKAAFDEELVNAGDRAVIVDYTATWCGPCRRIAPLVEELAGKYPSIVFLKVDVDENEETAKDQQVSSMPTFLVYRNGINVDEMIGANTSKLEALVEKYAV
jgi:thioredoxin